MKKHRAVGHSTQEEMTLNVLIACFLFFLYIVLNLQKAGCRLCLGSVLHSISRVDDLLFLCNCMCSHEKHYIVQSKFYLTWCHRKKQTHKFNILLYVCWLPKIWRTRQMSYASCCNSQRTTCLHLIYYE